MSSYPLLTTLNAKRWDISSNNITTTNYISCNGGSQTGTYYSNNGNAVRFPSGPTALRPALSYDGYLRYNTDTSVNSFEYFIADTNQWIPIVSPPTITSISPTFTTDASGIAGYYNINQNPLIITGTGFQSGASVGYRSQSGIIYYAADVSFNSTLILKASVPASVYAGTTSYNDDPFSIIVTNPSGLFAILPDALDSNPVPVWTTAAGSLGTFDASTNLTTQVQVVATDPEGQPIGYALTPGNSLPPGTSLGVSTGYITGQLPTLPNSTTYTFSIDASDNTTRVPRTFSLTVNGPRTATVSFPSTTWSYTITYSSSSGTGSFATPQPGGYTIYTFNPNPNSPSSQALVPAYMSNANTFQPNVATYTFTPNFTSSSIAVLIVGGGGAGAGDGGTSPPNGNGGGGGGGLLYNFPGTLTITSGTLYTITVGAGAGKKNPSDASPNTSQRFGGASSSMAGSGFTTLTANGGGGGGYYSNEVGQAGGSGGGSANNNTTGGGAATQTSIGLAIGKGGKGANGGGTGGSGAGGGGAGGDATNQNGADGFPLSITGTSVYYAGGGGGNGSNSGTGGQGGGTAAGTNPVQGTDGLGGGSGAQISGGNTAVGGSGVVIIRYKTYSG